MFATPAYAQTAGAAAAGGGLAASIISFAPLILIFIAFYFLMIRPQQQRMKQQQAAVEAAQKGDEVTTAGGIVGKVTRVEGPLVEVEIAPNVRVKVVKSTLSAITATGGAKAAAKSADR